MSIAAHVSNFAKEALNIYNYEVPSNFSVGAMLEINRILDEICTQCVSGALVNILHSEIAIPVSFHGYRAETIGWLEGNGFKIKPSNDENFTIISWNQGSSYTDITPKLLEEIAAGPQGNFLHRNKCELEKDLLFVKDAVHKELVLIVAALKEEAFLGGNKLEYNIKHKTNANWLINQGFILEESFISW